VDDSRIRLVAGLGNPGPKYAGTRHNVGFDVVDFLAESENAIFEQKAKWGAALAQVSGVFLVKPLTFMNLSGEPLAAVADFYKVPPEEVLVVLEDFALPLGKLRIRPKGGAAGHNGLESVIVNFATEYVPRLRLGIGAAPEYGSVDYVLSAFFEKEKEQVRRMIERGAQAVKCAIDNGLVSAMNTFNSEIARGEQTEEK